MTVVSTPAEPFAVAEEHAPGRDAVVAGILERLEDRLPAIAERLVDSYREEIIDYRSLGRQTLVGDIAHTALSNVKELFDDLRAGTLIDDGRLERFRQSAIRRARQGVSFEGLLRAYRLWGEVLWEEVLGVTSIEAREEREAALWIAGRVMAHVNAVSTAVAQAYRDEVAGARSDRGLLRGDLLETLISGRVAGEHSRRQAAALRLDLAADHLVVLAGTDPLGAGRQTPRGAIAIARRHLRPLRGPLLVGLREGRVVAIYPVAGPQEAGVAGAQARALAAQLGSFVVALGRPHDGPEGIGRSYQEAHEALEIGLTSGATGRAVAFADVLLDHILRASPHSEALLEDTVRPITDYDDARRADLMETLRAYFESGFNLTRGAAKLHVHPNTVVYRLQRIKALTGHDPGDPDDLLLLVLGLKLLGLGRAARA